jgi:hypothetical protein
MIDEAHEAANRFAHGVEGAIDFGQQAFGHG